MTDDGSSPLSTPNRPLLQSCHTPISQLAPFIGTPSTRSVTTIVALIWPYSSSKRTLTVLLVEPDYRLRRHRGQIKVQFAGSSALAVANAAVEIGDEFVLGLEGALWLRDDVPSSTPGSGLEWELSFSERLVLEIKCDSRESRTIDIDHSTVGSVPKHLEAESSSPLKVTAPDVPTVLRQSALAPDQWTSPAFLRSSAASSKSHARPQEDFTTIDDYRIDDRGRKKLKFGRESGDWRYVETSQSPTSATNEEARCDSLGEGSESVVLPQQHTSELFAKAEQGHFGTLTSTVDTPFTNIERRLSSAGSGNTREPGMASVPKLIKTSLPADGALESRDQTIPVARGSQSSIEPKMQRNTSPASFEGIFTDDEHPETSPSKSRLAENDQIIPSSPSKSAGSANVSMLESSGRVSGVDSDRAISITGVGQLLENDVAATDAVSGMDPSLNVELDSFQDGGIEMTALLMGESNEEHFDLTDWVQPSDSITDEAKIPTALPPHNNEGHSDLQHLPKPRSSSPSSPIQHLASTSSLGQATAPKAGHERIGSDHQGEPNSPPSYFALDKPQYPVDVVTLSSSASSEDSALLHRADLVILRNEDPFKNATSEYSNMTAENSFARMSSRDHFAGPLESSHRSSNESSTAQSDGSGNLPAADDISKHAQTPLEAVDPEVPSGSTPRKMTDVWSSARKLEPRSASTAVKPPRPPDLPRRHSSAILEQATTDIGHWFCRRSGSDGRQTTPPQHPGDYEKPPSTCQSHLGSNDGNELKLEWGDLEAQPVSGRVSHEERRLPDTEGTKIDTENSISVQASNHKNVSPVQDLLTTEILTIPDELLKTMKAGFWTSHAYFTPLSSLQTVFSNTIDVLGIVTNCTPASRAETGPRDYFLTLHITDPSLAPSATSVQIFRPFSAALPAVEAGDGILLRSFQVKSVRRRPGLLSTNESSWATWRGDGVDKEEVRGPPVELDIQERDRIQQLKGWWRSLTRPVRKAMQRAVGKPVFKSDPAGTTRTVVKDAHSAGQTTIMTRELL
ncbi:MAG: hypothetical protein M1817_000553 [Caeruleum heppii]|nr:MAG: hypothetical protein M1817_000553 [Caeruleum heppii]